MKTGVKKSAKGSFVTVRVKRVTYNKLQDNKKKSGTPISTFIDIAVDEKLKKKS